MQKNRSFGTGTRLTALFLLLLILIGSAAAAESGTFDLSHFRENDNLFTIDVNKDSGAAFIETALSSELRSFQHEYESDSYYSCTKFDILVRDYFKSSPTRYTGCGLNTQARNSITPRPSPSTWTARISPSRTFPMQTVFWS